MTAKDAQPITKNAYSASAGNHMMNGNTSTKPSTKGTNYSSDGFDGWVPIDVSVGVAQP